MWGKLQLFLTYLTESGMPTDVSELTTTHLRAFLVHLRENVKADENNPMKPAQDRSLSPKTIQGYARTLKAFFTWLHREGYIEGDPGKLLKIPKAPKVIIETLSDAQIKDLLSTTDQRSPKGFRDHCMMLILLDTGIRLSELVNLQVDRVDLEKSLFKVMGKGARERLVPFGAKVQTSMWKYLQRYRPEPAHPISGTSSFDRNGYPLSNDQVYRLIREYERRQESVGCGALRIHSATRLPRSSWSMAVTCSRFRRYWGTRVWRW